MLTDGQLVRATWSRPALDDQTTFRNPTTGDENPDPPRPHMGRAPTPQTGLPSTDAPVGSRLCPASCRPLHTRPQDGRRLQSDSRPARSPSLVSGRGRGTRRRGSSCGTPDPRGLLRRSRRRDLPLVAIDPPSSQDLDQAFAAEPLPSGYRVFYAIADVAALGDAGGVIDSEARTRGLTLYSPDRRTSLHPERINEDAGSLRAGQEREPSCGPSTSTKPVRSPPHVSNGPESATGNSSPTPRPRQASRPGLPALRSLC